MGDFWPIPKCCPCAAKMEGKEKIENVIALIILIIAIQLQRDNNYLVRLSEYIFELKLLNLFFHFIKTRFFETTY